jgi:ribose/xylose/arabinose/galactoside ABC-type transport system permease subunit
MKGILSSIINFFSDKQAAGIVNIPLFIVTLVILLVALWICIIISRKNRLYIRQKKDKKDNAYI